jgi:hypothetical protein
MRCPRLALLCVFAWLVSSPMAWGDESTDLLFFSADLMARRDYAGIGWLHAASGLDFTGPVFAAELGRQQDGSAYGQATAGWRFAENGVWATLMGGLEIEPKYAPAARPFGSFDLWWEPPVVGAGVGLDGEWAISGDARLCFMARRRWIEDCGRLALDWA